MIDVGMFLDTKNMNEHPKLIDRRERSSIPRVGETINVDHGEQYKVILVSHDWIDDYVQLLVEEY